ncbi:MAG TPA: flavoprotein [Tepidisphaeraceae bacterium]|nr:flavoprotein [Tepidisphaeraceae bacterium]
MANEVPTSTPVAVPLKGREIIIAVCGGIAAYKVADVVSNLVQLGAGVTVVMTAEATKFVTPLTFEALSGRKVRTSTFDLVDTSDPQHIGLTERSDLMLVAPATSNIMAQIAHGICDELVSLMIAASACPVVFAPAMNNRMWDHPIAQENVAKLNRIGYRFIGPEPGWLACRNVGQGRLSEPQTIVDEVNRMLTVAGELPPVVGQPQPRPIKPNV